MRIIILCCLVLPLTISLGCQDAEVKTEPGATRLATNNRLISNQTVDASCGQCQFGMEGSRCDLAVRIDGEPYFVDGAGIDDHGDAHGDDGMCNCVREAKVSGELKDGRFVATAFELLPAGKSKDDARSEEDPNSDRELDD